MSFCSAGSQPERRVGTAGFQSGIFNKKQQKNHPLLLFDKRVCRNCLCEEGKKLVIFPGTGSANKSLQQAVSLMGIDLVLEVVSVPSWECNLGRGRPLQLNSHLIQVSAEGIILGSQTRHRHSAPSLSSKVTKLELKSGPVAKNHTATVPL